MKHILLFLFLWLLISPAIAQEEERLEEVVVHGFVDRATLARRRQLNLQETAETIQHLSAADIERRGIQSLLDFSSYIPNMSFTQTQNIGTNFLTVRGIPQIRNGESPVAVIIDGVFMPDPNILNQRLYDIEMIEVVKGPQGTLYGKNALAGAINIVTKAPSNRGAHSVSLGYAKGNERQLALQSSAPLVKDKLFYRVSGQYTLADGLFYNTHHETAPDYLKDINLRGQLQYRPIPEMLLTWNNQYLNTQGGAVYYAHSPTGERLHPQDKNAVIDSDILGDSYLRSYFSSLNFSWQRPQFSLQAVSSYNRTHSSYDGDLDYTPAQVSSQYQSIDSETWSQEIRLLSGADVSKRWNWTLGTFTQHIRKPLLFEASLYNPDLGGYERSNFGRFVGVDDDDYPISDFTNTISTLAAFAFAEYKLTDKLVSSAGLRYDYDILRQENRLTGENSRRRDAILQPKFSVSYQFNKDFMTYANYGRGYRNGGYNQDRTEVFDLSFVAETSDSYEWGLKTSFWDNRLLLNASAFYVDFFNQQQYVAVFGTRGLLIGNFNYKRSRSTGLEFDGKLRLSRYLDLLGSYGLTDARIIDGGAAGETDRSAFNGNKTPFVPRSNYNISLESNIPLPKETNFSVMASLSGKDRMFWHDDNIDENPAYRLVDLRLQLQKGRYQVGLWGTNIFNTSYYTEYYAQAISSAEVGDLAWFGRPAVFGVNLRITIL